MANHSLILKSDGSLHTFGANHYGQLGDGTNTQRNTPTQILASGVSQIAAGQYHSLILKADGSLHTFGRNNYGQLGDGTTNNKNTPTKILASGVSQIAAGAYHSLILKTDGSLHTFGRNDYGQLGDGTTTQRTTPSQILASGVSQIAAGEYHSLIIKSDGSFHTFGRNDYAQLGDGTTTNKNTPTQILPSGVSQIATGNNYSLILKSDGSLHTFGANHYGELGDGSTSQRNTPTQILPSGSEVSQIAAGRSLSLILKSDGSLHTFGRNTYGQLGDGSTTAKNTPTQILAAGVSQIAAGYYHSLVLKADGSLHTFGYNSSGQLGDGTTNNRNTPTQILASGVARLSEQSVPFAETFTVGGGSTNQFDFNTTTLSGTQTAFGTNNYTINGFENGGQLFFNNLHIFTPSAQASITVHTSDFSIYGNIMPTTQILNGEILYKSISGIYYEGTLSEASNMCLLTPTHPPQFYDFTDSQGNNPNMTSFTFHKGSRYLFTANNISGSHPFMIGSSNGVNSPIVNGGPLTTNGHQIIVDIPQDFNSTLVYYCTNHTGMTQSMNIASPSGGYQSGGGGYQSPSGNTPNSTDGIELITNGDFNTNSDWTIQSNYSQTIQNGQLSLLRNGSNAEGTAQSINTVIGSTYKVIYNVVSVSGGYPRIYVGTTEDSFDVATLILSTGQGESSFTATSSTTWIHPSVAGSTTGSITFSKISVQKVLSQNGNSTITITSPGNGAQVTDSNDDLQVSITYQSNGGGYQTPTWAYKIDSGFPSYGSPHGGTQATGVTSVNDILNGQPYGQRQINVVLLDQGGNMHNPPITQSISVNYQSTGGGYTSPGGGYSSPGGGYQTPGGGYSSPGGGYQTPGGGYSSPGGGYQTPGSGYTSPGGGYTSPDFGGFQDNLFFVATDGNDTSGIGSYNFPYATISKAVQVASSGQTIIVKPGTYRGAGNKNISLLGKNLTIKSSNGPNTTIIDCEDNGRGFHISNGETNASIVGFTITNGSLGGVKVESGSNAEFWYCNIINNSSSESGPAAGGVTRGTYWYCKINDNVGNGTGPWNSGLGGGTTIANLNFCEVRRNIKFHNDNEAVGGVNYGTIQYCLITDNNSSGNIRVAGGVAHSTVTNCILYNNRTTASSLAAHGAIRSTFSNTIVWNPANSFSEMTSNSFGNGNTDPQFINAGIGDFRFQPNSPMINAGDPSTFDPDGSRADIGFDVGLLNYVYPNFTIPNTNPGSGYQTPGGGYTSPGGGYQTPGSGYQTPGGSYTSPGGGYQSPGSGYQTPGGGYQTPGSGYQTPGGGYTSPGGGYQTPGGGYQTPGSGYQTPGGGYQSPGGGYQTPGGSYTSPGGGYQSPGSGYQTPGGGYTSPSGGYYTPGSGYQSPSGGYQTPGGGYTSPGSAYQTPGGGYSSPGGGYGVPQVPVVNHFIPVVQTLSFQPSSGSDYRLRGKVLADGGSAVFEAGILISNSLGFNRTERRILANQSSVNSEFYVSVNDLTPGVTYYYKAFARNNIGETLGGWKKFKTSEQISQNSWLFETNDLGNGWRSSDWFGRFRKFNGINWIYHEHFGWLYAVDNQTGGAWFWSQDRGWCWSDKDVWPYIYQSRTGGWLYFLRHQAGSNVFYDYQNKTYFLSP